MKLPNQIIRNKQFNFKSHRTAFIQRNAKVVFLWTIIIFSNVRAADYFNENLEEYDVNLNLKPKEKFPKDPSESVESLEYVPVTQVSKTKDKVKGVRDINCMEFTKYSANCTTTAALIYNAERVSPPLPYKIQDWCKSLRFLTDCAIEWNTDCSESTDSFFNEDSIKGHMHVLDYICDDEWFLSRYRDMAICIEASSEQWEECYATFKVIADEQKNITREWTHFETHFFLCCAQAHFRRCTLDFVFTNPKKCSYDQAVTLQKFSVILSEGDVFQECDGTIPYANCPNGDPTPSENQLRMLMEGDGSATKTNGAHTLLLNLLCLATALIILKVNE